MVKIYKINFGIFGIRIQYKISCNINKINNLLFRTKEYLNLPEVFENDFNNGYIYFRVINRIYNLLLKFITLFASDPDPYSPEIKAVFS